MEERQWLNGMLGASLHGSHRIKERGGDGVGCRGGDWVRSPFRSHQDPRFPQKVLPLPIRSWPSRIGHIPMRPPSNNSTANISEHQLSANGQDIHQQSFYRAPRNQSRAAPGVLMTNHTLPVLTMEFAQGFPTEQGPIGSNYDR